MILSRVRVCPLILIVACTHYILLDYFTFYSFVTQV